MKRKPPVPITEIRKASLQTAAQAVVAIKAADAAEWGKRTAEVWCDRFGKPMETKS